jgi:hypothetical protein
MVRPPGRARPAAAQPAQGRGSAPARHGPQQVLGAHDRVMLAEPIDLGLDVTALGRVHPCHLLPAGLEVAADAVAGLSLAVQRDLAGQQSVVGPGSPTLYSMTATFSPVLRRSTWLSC